MQQHAGPVSVRVAGTDDVDAVTWIVATLDGAVDDVVRQAVAAGTVGSLLLDANRAALLTALNQFAAPSVRDADSRTAEVLAFLTRLTLPLLAFGQDGDVVGGLYATAPGKVIAELRDSGWPLADALEPAVRAAKVGQLWVDPAWRRRGVGAALLSTCCDVYFGANYQVVYGTVNHYPDPVLERFYSSAGFRFISEGDGVSVGLAAGPIDLSAVPGQGMFYRRRGRWRSTT